MQIETEAGIIEVKKLRAFMLWSMALPDGVMNGQGRDEADVRAIVAAQYQERTGRELVFVDAKKKVSSTKDEAK